VVAGKERPDAVALATGRNLATVRRLMVTAHNLGVMERLRDLPALRALLEEARSFESWRGLRTYLAILGEYAPALSREQKALALDFFIELLGHRDDDIRYHAANRIGDLLAGERTSGARTFPRAWCSGRSARCSTSSPGCSSCSTGPKPSPRKTWLRRSASSTRSRSSCDASCAAPSPA